MSGSQLQYEDQSALDLCLNLVQDSVELEQFQILEKSSIFIDNDCNADVMIIGSSHLFRVRIGGIELWEVFACSNLKTESRRVYCVPLKHALSSDVTLDFRDRVRYSFGSKLYEWSEGRLYLNDAESRAFHSSTGSDPLSVGLTFEFPADKDSKHSPPTTVVYAGFENSGLDFKVRTVHTYPNESNIVTTNTIIKMG